MAISTRWQWDIIKFSVLQNVQSNTNGELIIVTYCILSFCFIHHAQKVFGHLPYSKLHSKRQIRNALSRQPNVVGCWNVACVYARRSFTHQWLETRGCVISTVATAARSPVTVVVTKDLLNWAVSYKNVAFTASKSKTQNHFLKTKQNKNKKSSCLRVKRQACSS